MRCEARLPNIVPDHPALMERYRSMPRVKPLRRSIIRGHIHADPQCAVFDKPRHHGRHQPIGDPLPAAFFRYVDPLQFAVATKALRTMPRD